MKSDMNLLLIEDNDFDVQILERCLKQIGASGSLVRARDGLDGLELLNRDMTERTLPRPYIILLDINMPRMNGHEFLEELRANDNLKHAQVIVFTTSDSARDIALAYRNNASGYIVKPTGSSGLRDVLASLQKFWDICEHPQH